MGENNGLSPAIAQAADSQPSAMLIVSNRYRLATVLVPKCASTTLISLFARLHDLPPQQRDRDALDAISSTNQVIDRQSDLIALPHERIVEAYRTFGDYTWFAVVRDPYARLLSNYHNKINRFCANFRKDLYLRYKAVQLVRGPAYWRDARLVMPYLHSRVTYREFVETLQRHGVDWDWHFRPQSDCLRLDKIAYTQLVRLESFEQEMTNLLREAGVPAAKLAEIGETGRLNASDGAVPEASEEIAVRPAVRGLYGKDFKRLDYAA
jgi:hypothetical protein